MRLVFLLSSLLLCSCSWLPDDERCPGNLRSQVIAADKDTESHEAHVNDCLREAAPGLSKGSSSDENVAIAVVNYCGSYELFASPGSDSAKREERNALYYVVADRAFNCGIQPKRNSNGALNKPF